LFDTYQSDRYHKPILAYRLHDGGRLIFEGADFHCSPLHAIDSDETVAGLLSFLSLQPGDTDPESFSSCTLQQLEWAKSFRAELLGYLADELERGPNG
jgi:hypothetical protein